MMKNNLFLINNEIKKIIFTFSSVVIYLPLVTEEKSIEKKGNPLKS